MNIRVGFVPYLNMVPFHHHFGPEPVEAPPRRFEFLTRTPHALGADAREGTIDAGALSLVDWFQCSGQYEPVGPFGIGVRRAAQSVLLFSKGVLPSMERTTIAVTDETSTSFRLLQLLVEQRYRLTGVRFGRVASGAVYDGSADGLLLIGDEALRAKRDGIRGLPVVTDLGEEWYGWHRLPFVFARWVVRCGLHQDVKDSIETFLEKSLRINEMDMHQAASAESSKRGLKASDVQAYWQGFAYRMTPSHLESIQLFSGLAGVECLSA